MTIVAPGSMSVSDRKAAARGRVTTPLSVAACFAMSAGLLEAGILFLRRYVFHHFSWAGPEVMWMSPISYLLFLLPIGVLFALPIVRSWRHRDFVLVLLLTSVIVFVLMDVAFAERIHTIARALLAIGAGYQLARVTAHSDAFYRLARRGALALAVFVLWLGAAQQLWRTGREEFASSSAVPARTRTPNVVMIILDTVRAASMSLYGFALPTTPQLEKFARNAVTFDRAIVTAPWTLPSHASIFTGRWPHEMSASWVRPLGDSYPTLAEALQSRGYATGAFMANFYFTTPETGLGRGFDHFDVYPVSLREVVLSSQLGQMLDEEIRGSSINERMHDRKTAAEVNEEFLDWAVGQDRPFFAVLNYFDAHRPYHADSSFARQFGKSRKMNYAGSIAYIDGQLGKLFRALEEDHLLDNTVVIITSDHGELFGEGNPGVTNGVQKGGMCPCGHGKDPFFAVLHVPLVVAAPNVPDDVRVATAVTLRDLPATVMDLIGADGDHEIPGRSLARYWEHESPTDNRPVLSEVRFEEDVRAHGEAAPFTFSLVNDSLHYLQYPDGRELLFNHRTDPDEHHDLALNSARKSFALFRDAVSDFLQQPRSAIH